MMAFEEAGRAIDRELEKLRRFVESELKPTTKRRAIEALRATSLRLARLARKLEGRGRRAGDRGGQ